MAYNRSASYIDDSISYLLTLCIGELKSLSLASKINMLLCFGVVRPIS